MTIQQVKSEIRSAKMSLKSNPKDVKEQARLEKYQSILKDLESEEEESIEASPAKAVKQKAVAAPAKVEPTPEKKTQE